MEKRKVYKTEFIDYSRKQRPGHICTERRFFEEQFKAIRMEEGSDFFGNMLAMAAKRTMLLNCCPR